MRQHNRVSEQHSNNRQRSEWSAKHNISVVLTNYKSSQCVYLFKLYQMKREYIGFVQLTSVCPFVRLYEARLLKCELNIFIKTKHIHIRIHIFTTELDLSHIGRSANIESQQRAIGACENRIEESHEICIQSFKELYE